MLAASDGSVEGCNGAFGWIMSTPNGERLASCGGYAYGTIKGGSFRAEGYGQFSWLQFMICLQEFTGLRFDNSMTAITDNRGLIKRVDTAKKDFMGPNSTLQPDWDVIQAIDESINCLQFHLIQIHEKGHQTWGFDMGMVYCIGNNKVWFHMNNCTVNSKYKQMIRYNTTEQLLLSHIRKRNGWTDQVLNSVDWQAHGRAISSQDNNKSTLIKLIHDILPTARMVNKYNPSIIPSCLSCNGPEEDRIHLLRCIQRENYQTTLLRQIRKVSSKNKGEEGLQN